MRLFRFVFRGAGALSILTGLAALISGACNAGLIALVNKVLSHPESPLKLMVWAFAALGLGKLATNAASEVLLARFSQGAVARLRRDLIHKILTVPLRTLEKIGAPCLMASLTEDVLSVAEGLLIIPNFAVNFSILVCGAAYLCWLSWEVAVALFIFMLLGAAAYRLMIAHGFDRLRLARGEADRLHTHFRSLTEGLKELKLHRDRRRRFLSDCIHATTESLSRHNIAAEVRFIAARGWSQFLFFAIVGIILFLLPTWQNISPRALTGYIVTTLYLMGPLSGVLGSLSAFGRSNIALERIERIGLSLAAQITEECSLTEPERAGRFSRIELRGIAHTYSNEKDDSHFTLGPLNLSFQPGEIVFLVGGNGSGKSTLAKIITGLYTPEFGEIRLDGDSVTDLNRDNYRQLFSAIFADFHLFENLLGLDSPNLDARARDYLAGLHLEHKVTVRNGAFSTLALSQGQRKRLALLTACLEDRPFYLFDEWASDQDPVFKDVFYRRIVPDLKARGKTIVVISHDDAYFDCADRVLKLDCGALVYEKPVRSRRARTPGNEALSLALETV